jgi:hypothetical protein
MAFPTKPHRSSKGTERSCQVPRPFCLRFAAVSHLKSLQKQLVAAKRKEIARCARINAVDPAFLIGTEGGCVAVI